MDKFRGKYRIQSNRMPGWDYSGNGFYFITLVTQNRDCNLGEIIDGFRKYQVDTHGRAYQPDIYENPENLETRAKNENLVDMHGRAYQLNFRETRAYIQLSDFGKIIEKEWLRSFEIRNELFLDEYIIMPNHIHAIIVLYKGTKQITSTYESKSEYNNSSEFIRKPQSISSFIAGFKAAVNSKIDDYIDNMNLDMPKYNRNNHFFQPNYHDRIIRNNNEYYRIKEYIKNNPSKWNTDKLKLQTL